MNRIFAAVPLSLLPALSFAQVTYDTTAAVAAIDAGGVAIAAIGGAFLAIAIGLKVWSMLRR